MNPILIEIGPLLIHWYSLFIAIGLLLGGTYVLKEAKYHGISEDQMIDFFFFLIPIAFIGARLYFVLFHLDYYLQYPMDILKVWEGGLAIHGGILAGLLYLLYFTKKNHYSPLFFCDMAVVALILGQAAPGVPVWQTGAESKFPGLSYIIFPGNVGEADTLCQLVKGLL